MTDVAAPAVVFSYCDSGRCLGVKVGCPSCGAVTRHRVERGYARVTVRCRGEGCERTFEIAVEEERR